MESLRLQSDHISGDDDNNYDQVHRIALKSHRICLLWNLENNRISRDAAITFDFPLLTGPVLRGSSVLISDSR